MSQVSLKKRNYRRLQVLSLKSFTGSHEGKNIICSEAQTHRRKIYSYFYGNISDELYSLHYISTDSNHLIRFVFQVQEGNFIQIFSQELLHCGTQVHMYPSFKGKSIFGLHISFSYTHIVDAIT